MFNGADLYEKTLEELESHDRRVCLAAHVVRQLHPGASAIANDLLHFAAFRYPGIDVIKSYVERARALAVLQEQFEKDPRKENLGNPGMHLSRDIYNITLLLSIPFTNHRFEIMQKLAEFLAGCNTPSGRLASIGTGTGYELRMMASTLPASWRIEGYDLDESVKADAQCFLEYFGVRRPIDWAKEFSLRDSSEFKERYDAIVLCEVLEHLEDPAGALKSLRYRLTRNGRIFLTMAVNIAQEDHVFLYPSITACRQQIQDAGLMVESEWLTPQTILPPSEDRETGFRKGNYVAVAFVP